MLAPITATGFLRIGDSAIGRETQSSAFFNAPGIEPLYSGVAMRIPSAAGDRGLQGIDRVGCEILEILVERRDLGETVEDDELDAVGQLFRGEAEELRVV